MKSICLVLVLVLAICVLNVNADPCRGLNDFKSCKRDECCVRSTNSRYPYECEDKGDRVNDPCGGDYACNDCDNGLVCVPYPRSMNSRIQYGTGTCQRDNRRG